MLHANNVKQLTQYIKEVYTYLLHCNAFARAARLSHPGNRHEFAERLDQDLLQACLVAEQKLKRYGEPAWSIELDQARKKVTLLKQTLTMIRTQLDMWSVITEGNAKLISPMIELPVARVYLHFILRDAPWSLQSHDRKA